MIARKNSNPIQKPKELPKAKGLPDKESLPAGLPHLTVGLGIPAGGLGLLKKFFAGIPTGHGMAFLLVQSIGPSQQTLTADLLKDHTSMTVVEAGEGLIALADHLYVIPPDRHLTFIEGRMSLVDPIQCHGLCLSIDHFFCTLAADQKSRAAGIILSGTGSDGTIGLAEIKAAGGRTIVEDPQTAEFTDLPPNTITAGVADQVLPVEKMGEALLSMAARMAEQDLSGKTGELPADFRAILNILTIRTGHDFRCYKKSTLIRRIRRRMALHRLKHPSDYRAFMEVQPDEARLLQKDLLIGVTDFFRQPEAWRLLEEKVLPLLVAKAGPENPIRVWVPGCSTGKEAYSLAILLTEQVESSGKPVAIQIFATDADEEALSIARRGTYPEDDLGANISPARKKKFFSQKNGQYQVAKAIREKVVFAPQNLTSDPPFSKLDLISCRNLLIYLGREVQSQIIALFHFALREGGFLFLGNAETVSGHEELFEPVFKKWRIYRRIGMGRRMSPGLPLGLPGKQPAAPRFTSPASSPINSLTFAVQRILADRFAPASVVVDRLQQLLYVHGAIENYLTIPGGETTMNVISLAREGLHTRLGSLIRRAVEENRTASITTHIRRDTKSFPVKATVTPLHQPREVDGLLLISFEEYQPRTRQRASQENSQAGDNDLQHLEDELKITQEELQGTIEQLESFNEELKASNEEAIASNEELQSANEELETSKEELQSLNEELHTVNTRLHEKVEELENTNNDISNLLGSTNIATVFLDRDFKVMRYTPAITRLLSLIPSDVGRPIADITRRFGDEALLSDARKVLSDLSPLAKEVEADSGRWYIRRITPYRTHDDRIEGVVVTFLDAHELKQSEQDRERLLAQLEAVINSIDHGVVIADVHGTVLDMNPAALAIHGYQDPSQAKRHLLEFQDSWELFDLNGSRISLDQWPLARLVKGETFSEWELRVHRKDTNRRGIWSFGGSPVRDRSGKVVLVVLTVQDVTWRKEAEEELSRVASFPMLNPQPIVEADLEGRVSFLNPVARQMFPDLEQRGPDHPWLADWKSVVQDCREWRENFTFREVPVGEKYFYQTLYYLPEAGRIRIYSTDMTKRKRAEEALRESEERFRAAFESAAVGIQQLDLDGNFLRGNDKLAQILGLTHEELGQLTFEQLTHPDDLEREKPLLEQLLKGERPFYTVEKRYLHKNGRPVWVRITSSLTEGIQKPYRVSIIEDITERKLAEDLIAESERSLKRAQEIAHLGSWELDVVHDKLTWSDEVYRIFGLKPREFDATYEAFLEAVHPEDRQMVDAAYSGSLREGRDFYEIEHRVVRKSTGEIRFVHEKCEHIRDENGVIIRSVGMVHDITGRRLAEEAIRRAKEEWERTFDSVPDLIAILDDQHRIVRVNKAMAERLGRSAEDCVGIYYHETMHGTKDPPEFCPHVLTMTDGQVHFAEIHEDRFNGDFLISTTPLFDAGGGLIGTVHVARDITERKRAEEAIRRAKEEWERTFDSVPDLIAILDDQHRIVRVNKAMAERLGCLPKNCLGLSCYEQVHGTDAPPAFCPHAMALADGREHVAEVHEERLGGDFLVSATPVFDAQGSIIGSVHVARDITERKKLEGEIRRSRDELEVRVRERTAELAVTNEGLILEITERQKAEEALQRSEEQLRSLAVQILTAQEDERKRIAQEVHDVLGSSLSAIKFKVEEALHSLHYDNSARLPEALEAVIPLVQETIEDARRIQTDLRPPLLDDLGIIATFSWFCRRFENIYSGIRVIQEITVQEDEVPDLLKVAIFRITQEAMNNIGKHAGASLIHLGLRRVDQTVELTVRDNGKGFDPDDLGTGGKSKKGMGLASMKERAEFWSGIFSLDSETGKGTTVKVVWAI